MKNYKILFEGQELKGTIISTSEMGALDKYARHNEIKERSNFVMINGAHLYAALVTRCGEYTAEEI